MKVARTVLRRAALGNRCRLSDRDVFLRYHFRERLLMLNQSKPVVPIKNRASSTLGTSSSIPELLGVAGRRLPMSIDRRCD